MRIQGDRQDGKRTKTDYCTTRQGTSIFPSVVLALSGGRVSELMVGISPVDREVRALRIKQALIPKCMEPDPSRRIYKHCMTVTANLPRTARLGPSSFSLCGQRDSSATRWTAQRTYPKERKTGFDRPAKGKIRHRTCSSSLSSWSRSASACRWPDWKSRKQGRANWSRSSELGCLLLDVIRSDDAVREKRST